MEVVGDERRSWWEASARERRWWRRAIGRRRVLHARGLEGSENPSPRARETQEPETQGEGWPQVRRET